MLFEDMTDEQCDHIESVTAELIFKGTIPSPIPFWLELWLNQTNNHSLVSIAVVFPARALYSVIQHRKK